VLHTEVDKWGKAFFARSGNLQREGDGTWIHRLASECREPRNDQMIKVELKVAMYSGPVVVVNDLIEFEYRVPDSSIAFELSQLLRHHMHV